MIIKANLIMKYIYNNYNNNKSSWLCLMDPTLRIMAIKP